MDMSNTPSTTIVTYQPTPIQSERAAALRRFNWFYIYTPVLVASLAILVVLGLLLWNGVGNRNETSRETISAVADLIVILTLIPLTLLCAALPASSVFLFWKARQNHWAPLHKTHVILWRIDNIASAIQQKVERVANRIVAFFANIGARVAYVITFVKQIINR